MVKRQIFLNVPHLSSFNGMIIMLLSTQMFGNSVEIRSQSIVRTLNSHWPRDGVQCPYREGRVRKVKSSVLEFDDDILEVDNVGKEGR